MIPYELHELPAVDERVLGEVVTAAFSQRRKMLRNTLAAFRDSWISTHWASTCNAAPKMCRWPNMCASRRSSRLAVARRRGRGNWE